MYLILADTGVTFPTTGYKTINADETKTFLISELGSLAFTLILVKNPDLHNTVEWEAEMFEE